MNKIVDEVISGKTDDKSTVSAGTFGLLALLFGEFGIHDFSMGWWKLGCGHLSLMLLGVMSLGFWTQGFLGPTLIVGSWAWAIGEVFYYRGKDVWWRADQIKDFLATARVTEILTGFMILLIGHLIHAIIVGKNCYASGCSGAGWTIVIIVWIGLVPFIINIICIFKTFTLRGKLSKWQLTDKRVIRNTIGVACLSIVIVALLVATIIVAFMNMR